MTDLVLLPHRKWLTWCCYLGGMSSRQVSESIHAGEQTVKSNLTDVRRALGIPRGTNRWKAAHYPFGRLPQRTLGPRPLTRWDGEIEAAIRHVHAEEMFGDCVEDGEPYPCKTIRLLDLLHPELTIPTDRSAP